jgi:hypothetical protein
MKRATQMLAALALLFGGVGQAKATPILEVAGGGSATEDPSASVGWSFTTNQSITVTALDAYDPSVFGSVRLYNASGVILAGATLTTSDSQEGSPTLFYTQAITPVTLAANTTYYIAEDVAEGQTPFLVNTNTPITSPLITYVGGVDTPGIGQTPTTDVFSGFFNPAYFGPNFDAGPAGVAASPEPASLTLFAFSGAALLGYAGLRRRKKAAIA